MTIFWGAFIVCMLFCLYHLSYVSVIVVTSSSEYHEEKVYIWQSYKGKYSVSIDKVYVDNQSDYSLLLNDYTYFKRHTFITPVTDLITIRMIPPHSFDVIGRTPDYILRVPPSSIAVRRKKGDATPATVRVLEVKNSVHDVFRHR